MSWLLRRCGAAISRGCAALSRPIRFICECLATRSLALFLLLSFMVAFFTNGILGLDFGAHWDEWYHVKVVSEAVQRLTLLPEAVSYGAPYFTLGYPVILAHEWRDVLAIIHELRTQPPMMDPTLFESVRLFKGATMALLGRSEYLLQVRGVFLGVTTLSIVWAFFAALRLWPRRYGVALAGAAFTAFSWELGYHARWVAIDAVLAQFCGLELFLFCGAWKAPSDGPAVRWFCAAAAAAGAVFACKMTGGFALLPVLLTPLVRRSHWNVWRRLRMVGLGILVFVLVSFAVSPNFYLYPMQFLHVIRGGDYNSAGPTYPHYVTVSEHAARLLVWLVAVVPSPLVPVALAFSAVTLIGFVSLLRRQTRMTLCWLVFMATFAAIFTQNHLLIVRNNLMFLPFPALCFAHGSAVIWDLLRARDRRLAPWFAALVAVGVIANAVFESTQAWRAGHDSPDSVADAAAKDLLSVRDPFRITALAYSVLRSRLGAAYTCHPADLKDERVKHVIAMQAEEEWMANRLGSFRHSYGAAVLNLEYYSTWFGRERGFRIVDVSVDVMKTLHLRKAEDLDCFPTGKPPLPARP
jgi:4-amino-4-deoxy-L-arabinose transferase-like glycosyltransferase